MDDEEEVFHMYTVLFMSMGINDSCVSTACGFNVGFQWKWISTEGQL